MITFLFPERDAAGPGINGRVGPTRGEAAPWNHNLHYHPVILRAIPPGCPDALDVGCGEGILTRRVRPRVPQVTGIDLDPASIEAARSHPQAGDITYLLGDVLSYPFEPASFALITAVASVHHMDAGAALARLSRLLRPGGVLGVIGLARPRYPADLPLELAAVASHRVHRLTKTVWNSPAPIVWPPAESYAEMRALAAQLLPGVRYRRHLLWRYSLVWRKPS